MQKHLFLLIALAIALSGCLDNATVEDRLACLELTSYSFASVPQCASQEKCFEEVEKNKNNPEFTEKKKGFFGFK